MARNGAFIIRFELSLIFTAKLSTAKKKWPIGHLQAVEKKVSRSKIWFLSILGPVKISDRGHFIQRLRDFKQLKG